LAVVTPPAKHLYTVDEVADRLNLHVKTIRRYIQEGRLKARRIGKEYRITRGDLDEFAGGAVAPEEPVARTRHVTATTIVDIDAISTSDSERLTTLVMGGMNARKGEGDYPRVDTIYFVATGRLRITITAGLELTASLLRVINAVLEDNHGDHL
jgi:excisionase family DNA binding protein